MVAECWAILLVLAVMLYVFLSRGKPGVAGAILPLMILPGLHLLGSPTARVLFGRFPGIPTGLLHVGVDLVGVVVSCLLVGVISRSIAKKSSRNTYILLCCGFTVVLAWVLIYDLIGPIVVPIHGIL